MTDQKPVRLVYRGRPCGPEFRTADEAQAFVAWLEARTGLEWHLQPAAALERLANHWRERGA